MRVANMVQMVFNAVVLSVIGCAMLSFSECVYADVTVSNVTAHQLDSSNGYVRISYDISCTTEYAYVEIQAVDVEGGSNLLTQTFYPTVVTKGHESGHHETLWHAAADIGIGSLFPSVRYDVTAYETPPLYCVIDLSKGKTATHYPVSALHSLPENGWTDEYKTNKLVLRWIPPGSYLRRTGVEDNAPIHSVTMTKGYYIGVFEVTQRQYELVTGSRPSFFRHSDYYATRPVENCSYNMIRGGTVGAGWPQTDVVDESSFLGILCRKTGLKFDLPTEAQWVFANVGGVDGRYCQNSGWSDMVDGGGPKYKDIDSLRDCSFGTAQVGSYSPNGNGIYDMNGNVCEWCLDWWESLRDRLDVDVVDPKGPLRGSERLMMGGDWQSMWLQDWRGSALPWISTDAVYSGYDGYGFRLARTLH